jgi:hypothetical protein
VAGIRITGFLADGQQCICTISPLFRVRCGSATSRAQRVSRGANIIVDLRRDTPAKASLAIAMSLLTASKHLSDCFFASSSSASAGRVPFFWLAVRQAGHTVADIWCWIASA